MALRNFINGSPQTTTTGVLTNSTTSITVASLTGFPASAPYFATLEIGTINAEAVLVTAIAGTTLTVTRGQDGTTAVTHASGATFDHVILAVDHRDSNTHVNAVSGAHGITGPFASTTDTQTLTNKTLTSPTMTGTSSGVNATLSGTLAVTGTSTLSGAVTAGAAGTGLAVTNNETVGGTLGVTGTATVGAVSTVGTITSSSVSAVAIAATSGTVAGKFLAGDLQPTIFTNEAAANAAGANVNGTVCLFTAPTTFAMPGLATYNTVAALWVPLSGALIKTVTGTLTTTSTGATEALSSDLLFSISAAAGRTYWLEVFGRMIHATAGSIVGVVIHGSQAAITTASPVVAQGNTFHATATVTGSQDLPIIRYPWTPGASGTWNLQVGVKSVTGAGNSSIGPGVMNPTLSVFVA